MVFSQDQILLIVIVVLLTSLVGEIIEYIITGRWKKRHYDLGIFYQLSNPTDRMAFHNLSTDHVSTSKSSEATEMLAQLYRAGWEMVGVGPNGAFYFQRPSGYKAY